MVSLKEKKQKILIVVLIVLILAVVVILVWNFSSLKTGKQFSKTISETSSFGESKKVSQIGTIVSTELDLSVLEKTQFKNLRSYGDLPVKAGQTGRPNPFLPH